MVEHGEDRRIVHLALVGFGPRRHRRDLDMADDREVALETLDEVAAFDLRVIEVELYPDIVSPRCRDNGGGLLGAADEVVGPVASVERFGQHGDALRCRKIGSAHEIGDEGLLALGPPFRRHRARHAMDRATADRHGVVERLAEMRIELALAPGNTGKPRLPVRRQRRVDAEHDKTVALDLAAHRRGRRVVGELQLDRRKAHGRRRSEPLKQRPLGKEVGEIGGESRHRLVLGERAAPAVRLTLFHFTTRLTTGEADGKL